MHLESNLLCVDSDVRHAIIKVREQNYMTLRWNLLNLKDSKLSTLSEFKKAQTSKFEEVTALLTKYESEIVETLIRAWKASENEFRV